MHQPPSAHIFLKEWNSVVEDETTRAVRVLHSQAPIGCALQAVEEMTLAPGVSISLPYDEAILAVLPVVGNLEVTLNKELLELCCGQITCVSAGAPVTIRNPYPHHLVRFICIRIKEANPTGALCYNALSFNLRAQPGICIPLIHSDAFRISLGIFFMRAETLYTAITGNPCIFLYTLQGSMEIEGRLLHEGDALSLWNCREAALESFGKESILLIVETPVSCKHTGA